VLDVVWQRSSISRGSVASLLVDDLSSSSKSFIVWWIERSLCLAPPLRTKTTNADG